MALLVLALIGSLLALAVPPPSAAGAQVPENTEETHTQWQSQCVGRVGTIAQPQVEPLGFTLEHPDGVAPGTEFTYRVVPDEGYLPDVTQTVVGPVTVFGLRDIKLMFDLPVNAEVLGVELVPDSTYNTAGPYSVAIDNSFTPSRIVLSVKDVVKNPSLPDGFTPFRHPSFDVTVRATGPLGSSITTRTAGTNDATSGYTFLALNSTANANVRCWPEGEVPGPTLMGVPITSGSAALPTTTTLSVEPTILPAGNDVSLSALVTTGEGGEPSPVTAGAVRFNDGSTVLGLDEVDLEGIATFTGPLSNIGNRTITATYLGAPNFESSVSPPVAVTVTNPANRTPVQVLTVLNNTRVVPFGSPSPVTATITVSPTGAATAPPTGLVKLYDGNSLVATQALVGGATVFNFTVPVEPTARTIRAEYAGDTAYFAGSGTAPIAVTLQNGSSGTDRDLSGMGGITFNGVTGDIPFTQPPSPALPQLTSKLSSTFRTGPTGVQDISGVLYFDPAANLSGPGGSLSGRLAQVGNATGQIAAGADAAASLSANLYLQVASANFGSGTVSFDSTCAIGPFSVNLTGTRQGTAGPLTLAQSGFSVPFAQAGTCIDDAGASRAAQVGALVAGALTNLSVTLTPPAAGASTSVSAVIANPANSSSFGQPVTLSATVSTTGPNFPGGSGRIEFYAGNVLLGGTTTPFIPGPTQTVSLAFPFAGTSFDPVRNPIPQGTQPLRAQYVPNDSNRLTYATSPLSSPTSYTVLPSISKQTPMLTLDVVDTATAGEPVTLTATLSPAPSSVAGAAQLAGSIRVFDRTAPDGQQEIPLMGSGNALAVSASSGGTYTSPIALAPGSHSLEAIFTPTVESAWGWNVSFSSAVAHTVVGEAIPTSLTVFADSTRGTGKVPVGRSVWVTVQLTPQLMANLGPGMPSVVATGSSGSIIPITVDPSGRATVTFPNNSQPGPAQGTISFDPFLRDPATGSPAFVANQGFAPSSVTFGYEVVVPGSPGPMPTGVEIATVVPSPIAQGATWSQVNGYVTFDASGSVTYFARNKATAQVTQLGTASVSTGSSASTGRGLARLNSPAPSNTLPVGAYEVFGNFTPTNPALFAPSSSAPFVVHVVSPISPVVSSTELSVSPSPSSFFGEGVTLTADVSPTYASPGNVEFLDGETSLGTAPVANGSAQKMVFTLSDGPHSLTAKFLPTNATIVTGSTSDPVAHTVTEPAIETSTSLGVSPTGPVQLGDEVTFTAAVSPSDAPGSVFFEDQDGDLAQTVAVIDGQAVLVTDELEAGTHDVTATFVPSDPTDYTESESEPVSITVISGPVSTEISLSISPETSAPIGDAVTLTASVEPTDAPGTVTFYDGDVPLSDAIAVIDGEAEAIVSDLPIGHYEINAVFEPADPELWAPSASEPQSYEITLPTGAPVFACQGSDDVSRNILIEIVQAPGGIVYLETPLTATVPETLASGQSGDVSFTWTTTLPENLAQLVVDAQASEVILEDMTIAVEATGGSTQVWELPDTFTMTDPYAPITLETQGEVTASEVADILYGIRSPLEITIHVPPTPLVFQDVYVNLTCDVTNAIQAITEVSDGPEAPGAPTGVTATGGPLQANVSWTPPANDGGSAITGYVITSSPDNKVVHTSADVTNIDVIGLTAGQNYTFVVQAINDVGTSEDSVASSAVSPTAGKDFTDVPTTNPFYSEIQWLYATGITTGTGPNTFGPENTLNRQGMAAFLYRLSGNPDGVDPTCDTAPFTDVPTTNEFCGEIQWLKDEGITQGTGDTFNPGGPLTRQAMSAYLYRLANGPDAPPPCTTAPFSDVPTTNAFCPQITWMAEMDITQTPPGGNFRPTDALKRQAMASFLYRYSLVVPTGL